MVKFGKRRVKVYAADVIITAVLLLLLIVTIIPF